MSFVKLEKRIGLNDTLLGASMSMRTYKSSAKPVAFVSLRKHFLETAKFKSTRFDVAVGEGDNAGKIRIAPNKDGAFAARELQRGALVIDLGHIPQLGDREHKKRSTDVILVDGAAIVTVPDWGDEESDEEEDAADEDEDGEVEAVPPPKAAVAPAPRQPLPARSPAVPPGPKSVTHNGVIINLAEGKETVSYRGGSVDVSLRGARLVEMLAKVMPSCIGDNTIVERIWNQKLSAMLTTSLDLMCRDLANLKKIGLEIRVQRGVGRQLVVIA